MNPGSSYYTYSPNVETTRSISITFDPEKQLPAAGSAVRAMFVCQPTLYKADVILGCCHHARVDRLFGFQPQPAALQPPADVPAIESETGLKYGHLLDTAERLRKEHALCPYAEAHDHNEDGSVKVRVTFAGKLQLRDNDPALEESREDLATQAIMNEEWQRIRDRWGPYIQAKHQGR